MDKIKRILCVSILLAFIIQCKKSSPSQELPPITQDGKNTFGCKVNGQVWIPNIECNFFTDPCGSMQVSVVRAYPDSAVPLAIDFSFGNKTNGLTTYLSMISRFITGPPRSYFREQGVIFASLTILYISNGNDFYAATGNVLWGFAPGSSVIDGATVVQDTVYWGSGYAHFGPFFPFTGNNKFFAFTPNGT